MDRRNPQLLVASLEPFMSQEASSVPRLAQIRTTQTPASSEPQLPESPNAQISSSAHCTASQKVPEQAADMHLMQSVPLLPFVTGGSLETDLHDSLPDAQPPARRSPSQLICQPHQSRHSTPPPLSSYPRNSKDVSDQLPPLEDTMDMPLSFSDHDALGTDPSPSRTPQLLQPSDREPVVLLRKSPRCETISPAQPAKASKPLFNRVKQMDREEWMDFFSMLNEALDLSKIDAEDAEIVYDLCAENDFRVQHAFMSSGRNIDAFCQALVPVVVSARERAALSNNKAMVCEADLIFKDGSEHQADRSALLQKREKAMEWDHREEVLQGDGRPSNLGSLSRSSSRSKSNTELSYRRKPGVFPDTRSLFSGTSMEGSVAVVTAWFSSAQTSDEKVPSSTPSSVGMRFWDQEDLGANRTGSM